MCSRYKVVLERNILPIVVHVTRIDNPGRGMPFRDTDLRPLEVYSASKILYGGYN